jgi:hypothetical protein
VVDLKTKVVGGYPNPPVLIVPPTDRNVSVITGTVSFWAFAAMRTGCHFEPAPISAVPGRAGFDDATGFRLLESMTTPSATWGRRVRLHRALLQSKTQALEDRLYDSRGIREAGWISLSRCHPNRVQAIQPIQIQARWGRFWRKRH